MKQSTLRYWGLFVLLLVAAFVAVFGLPALTAGVVLPVMVVAGVCFLVAGSVAELAVGPVAVTCRHLVGVGYALFALRLPASTAPPVVAGGATTADVALFAVAVLGGLTLLFVGVDVARGGRHFQITPDVDAVVGR
ncbi:hypothetical protein ACFQH6_03120 [Halobacteriaceae archaeon GCM10025711]